MHSVTMLRSLQEVQTIDVCVDMMLVWTVGLAKKRELRYSFAECSGTTPLSFTHTSEEKLQ